MNRAKIAADYDTAGSMKKARKSSRNTEFQTEISNQTADI
jgi:hypothetical protein